METGGRILEQFFHKQTILAKIAIFAKCILHILLYFAKSIHHISIFSIYNNPHFFKSARPPVRLNDRLFGFVTVYSF